MSGNICLNYQLIDSGEYEKMFHSLQEVQSFVKGIGEEMFSWVMVHIPNDFSEDSLFIILESYEEIVQYGR